MTVPGGIKAGKISKPYGLQGEVHIILIPNGLQNIKEGTPLFIDLDGQRVPFFIESFDQVSDDQAIAKLEFVDSIEEAKKVSGCDVYLDQTHVLVPESEIEGLARLVGYQAIDLKLGMLGTVSAHVPQELNPVWIIDSSGKEIMVPATNDFILESDHKKRILYLDLPDGICEL